MNFDVNLFNILATILGAVLGAFLIIYYFRTILDTVINRKLGLIFVVVFGLVNGYISSLMSSLPIKPIILIVLSIVIIKILLKTTFLQSFFSFALYTIALALGNPLVPIVASLFISDYTAATMQNTPMMLLLNNLMVNVVALLIFTLIKPLKSYIKIVSRNIFLIIMTVVTIAVICSSFALYFLLNSYSLTVYLVIASVSLSYCIFIILIWFNALRKAISDEDLSQQKFYNESLRSTLFDLRRFKHDWCNNLTVVNSMLKMDKVAELKQYVSELIAQSSEHNSTELYNLKNAGLFGIISSKINLANDKGIAIDLSVIGEIENIPGIKLSELCEIVGIFLDNAIEEASKNAKSIGIRVQNSISYIEITISNYCESNPDLQMIYRDGFSTKGENRGMGLAIAKKIIDKNKNILHITSFDEKVFTQTIEILKKKGA